MQPHDPEQLAQRAREELEKESRGLLFFALLAIVSGLGCGVISAAFRLVLHAAATWRLDLASHAHALGVWGVVLPVLAVAGAAALARRVVRWAPEAAGSGVQRVEAVMRGQVPPARPRVLPAKFIGGAVALGSGLVLGREGPTVQMGATIGDGIAALFHLSDADLRDLQAATAGAGLGVAFSAPLGGAMFTFEEVRRGFTMRMLVVTLLACATAWMVGGLILGVRPDFAVPPLTQASWTTLVPALVFGAALGVLGVAYNFVVVELHDRAAWFTRVPPEARAAVIGGIVGLGLWLEPRFVGGGDALTQSVLNHSVPLDTILLVLAFRWVLGPLSYAAGTPGGLFSPLILLGALFGAAFATVTNHLVPGLTLDASAFAIIGMSTFFSATVRAPFTGIVLVVEMTAITAEVIPMLVAAAAAVYVASRLGGLPIYDTLRFGMLREMAERRRTATVERASEEESSGGQEPGAAPDR